MACFICHLYIDSIMVLVLWPIVSMCRLHPGSIHQDSTSPENIRFYEWALSARLYKHCGHALLLLNARFRSCTFAYNLIAFLWSGIHFHCHLTAFLFITFDLWLFDTEKVLILSSRYNFTLRAIERLIISWHAVVCYEFLGAFSWHLFSHIGFRDHWRGFILIKLLI